MIMRLYEKIQDFFSSLLGYCGYCENCKKPIYSHKILDKKMFCRDCFKFYKNKEKGDNIGFWSFLKKKKIKENPPIK